MTSRQVFGSKGTSSEPKVNTAARSRVRRIPPIVSPQRCLDSSGLIFLPSCEVERYSAPGGGRHAPFAVAETVRGAGQAPRLPVRGHFLGRRGSPIFSCVQSRGQF